MCYTIHFQGIDEDKTQTDIFFNFQEPTQMLIYEFYRILRHLNTYQYWAEYFSQEIATCIMGHKSRLLLMCVGFGNHPQG